MTYEGLCHPLEEKSADLMIDMAWHIWEEGNNDKRDMETKASIILAADGILLGLLATAVTSDGHAGNNFLILLMLFSSTVSLGISAFCCIKVLDTREYKVINLEKTKIALRDCFDDKMAVLDDMYNKLAIQSCQARDNLSIMEKWFSKGVFCLLAGVIFAVSFILLFAFIGKF